MTEDIRRIALNWSSGKDSALSLYHLKNDPRNRIERLVTSINRPLDRVSMHGVREDLLRAQQQSLAIPLTLLELPESPDNTIYTERARALVRSLKDEGIEYSAFGDIFLEDLRAWRERQLAEEGVQAIFPLWQRDTRELMEEFLRLGFQAIIVSASAEFFDRDAVGRLLDRDFIANLPSGVDPCGENGEFHTFCFDGPVFQHPVQFAIGETVQKFYPNPDSSEGSSAERSFWFCDLLP